MACQLLVELFAYGIDQLAIIISRLVARFVYQSVARWVVEHHDVIQFYLSQSFYPAVVPMRPVQVTLGVDELMMGRVCCVSGMVSGVCGMRGP